MAQRRVIVVGGGLAGLAATIRLADPDRCGSVQHEPVKRSHSVCTGAGSTRATRWPGSRTASTSTSTRRSTVATFWPISHQFWRWRTSRLRSSICSIGWASFQPDERGSRPAAVRRLAVQENCRFAGATTGQQLIYAAHEQAAAGGRGQVAKYEFWEFLWRLRWPVCGDR